MSSLKTSSLLMSLQIWYHFFSLFVMFAAVAMPCTPVPEPRFVSSSIKVSIEPVVLLVKELVYGLVYV